MVNQTEELKELFLEMGALQVWARDPRVSGDLLAEAEAIGVARGKAEGREEGKALALREMTLIYLMRQFGELPESLVARLATANGEECQRLFDRAVSTTSLEEFLGTL